MAGTAVVAGGWRFAGALASGGANQSPISTRCMTEGTVHMMNSIYRISSMAHIARCASSGYSQGMGIFSYVADRIKYQLRRRVRGQEVTMTIGAGILSMAFMSGRTAFQDIDRRYARDRVRNGAQARMTEGTVLVCGEI